MSDNNSIVIIGAGIAGLSTAYHLCTSSWSCVRSIYVVDSSPPLDLAPSSDSPQFAGEWTKHAEISLSDKLSPELLHELAGAHDDHDVHQLSAFLAEECAKRGVNLLFDAQASAIVKDARGRITGLKIGHGSTHSSSKVLQCSDVIVAAGDQTARVFDTLFPENRLLLSSSNLGTPGRVRSQVKSLRNPIIGQVSAMDLGLNFHSTSGAKVWIASGDEVTSATTILGAGAVISQLISGEEPDVDVSGWQVENRSVMIRL